MSFLNKKLWVLLIKPESNYSTKDIFSKFNEECSKPSAFTFSFKNLINDMNINQNALEKTVIRAEKNVNSIISELSSYNSLIKPRITGSGSTVFVIFKKKQEMFNYKKNIRNNTQKKWIKTTYFKL